MPARYPVPKDQRRLARSKRQFPFRALNASEREEVREEAGKALQGVHDMIFKLLRKKAGKLPEDQLDDEFQHINLLLFQSSLPNYDAWRGVKLSTFLYQCIANIIKQRIRVMIIQKRTRPKMPSLDNIKAQFEASDQWDDRELETFVADVFADPEKFGLRKDTAKLLNLPTGRQNQTHARLLNILPTSLTSARTRLLEVIAEKFDPATPPK